MVSVFTWDVIVIRHKRLGTNLRVRCAEIADGLSVSGPEQNLSPEPEGSEQLRLCSISPEIELAEIHGLEMTGLCDE
jgi:hypothetical protein